MDKDQVIQIHIGADRGSTCRGAENRGAKDAGNWDAEAEGVGRGGECMGGV